MSRIEITGPGAEDAGRELQELLRAELGVEAGHASAATPEPGRKVDSNTLTAIAIVVALPGAIDATANLVKRVELVQKVKRLIAWAKGRRETGVRICVVSPKGELNLGTADPGDVVEALTEGTDKTGETEERA